MRDQEGDLGRYKGERGKTVQAGKRGKELITEYGRSKKEIKRTVMIARTTFTNMCCMCGKIVL